MSQALNYKSKKFWFILLFVIYSIFGWVGIPYIVKQQAISTLKDIAGWDTKIESVVFNPYALSLAIHDFQAKDGFKQDAVSFDRFYINFNALGSITGQISFDEINLSKPIVHAQLDTNGISNFQRDFVKEDTTPSEPDHSDPLAFFFELIAISNGQVHFSDHRTDETFQIKLEPLNLALHEFSTDQNDGGDYSLSLSLGQDQKIEWQGKIGIAPFASTGTLAIHDLRSASFWHYVKPFSPYSLQNALFSIEASYDTEFSDTVSRLVIDSGSFSAQQIKLADKLDNEPFFSLETLSLKPLSFDLEARKADLGLLEFDQVKLVAIRDENSSINVIKPLEASNTEEPTQQVASDDSDKESSAPFSWSIAGIRLNESSVNWQDKQLGTPADLTIDHINLVLGSISHELHKPFSYDVSFNTGDAQQTLKGHLAPQPLKLEGNANISTLPLNWAQPYIGENLNILLDQGQFNLSSEYSIAMNDQGLSGNIIANTSVNELALQDSISTQPLAGFQDFSISGITVNIDNNQALPAINIDEIKLAEPYAKAQVSQTGELNLAQLSKGTPVQENDSAEQEETSEASNTNEAESEATQSAKISIKNILIQKGRFDYIDASLEPVFNTYIDQFSGNISNVSSDLDAHSKVAISGNMDSFGSIDINGTANPLSSAPNTSLNIKVDNIDLTTASPYSAKYAGYLIDKGKLNLDLVYDINGSKLDATNEVFIDQFNFGESVDSPDATALPLPLALGIMKNLDGEIDIDLPINGDLNDPSFSIGGVLLTAFTNLITKIVTSPFSILGSLVEGADDMSSVGFSVSNALLNESESSKVLKLAEALKKRPNLSLEVRGVADRTLDLDANKQAQSEETLAVLAKNRALAITRVLTTEGKISEKRIFTLEPKVIATKPPSAKQGSIEETLIASTFTIKVD